MKTNKRKGFDAGARNIEVVIDIQALSFTVKDDGVGMSPDDLSEVGSLNYTSKLKTLDELRKITTFGFRGQALHSIGSMSTMVILSKTLDYESSFYTSIGNSKRLFQPKLIEEDSMLFTEQPKKHGTLIMVNNLFSNVPVRKTQAKKEGDYKVLQEIRDVISQCTFTNQETTITAYKATNKSKELICKVDGSCTDSLHTNIIRKISTIYGISLKNHHQLLHASYLDYKVTGVIGKIPVQTKAYQFMIWDNRVLKSPDLFKEINRLFTNAGFGSQPDILIPSMSKLETSPNKGRSPAKSASSVGSPYSRYPVFVVIISGPVSISDIIQNPSKDIESSKYLDIVTPLVLKIMKSFLKTNDYNVAKISNPKLQQNTNTDLHQDKRQRISNETYSSSEIGLVLNSKLKMGKLNQKEISGMLQTTNGESSHNKMVLPSTLNKLLKSNKQTQQLEHSCHNHKGYDFEAESNRLQQVQEVNISRDSLESCCEVVSQVDTKFILVKMNKPRSRLFIIDQHACDERIKVERYLKEFIEAAQDPFHDLSIKLGENQFDLKFNNLETELLHQYKAQLNTWGIRYVLNSENVATITHLPDLLIPKLDSDLAFLKKCLAQHLYDLHNKSKLKSLSKDWWSSLQAVPTILIDLINSKACRSAIMFGKKLTVNECEQMIKELSKCKSPFQCAHGRPSIVPICELSSFDK